MADNLSAKPLVALDYLRRAYLITGNMDYQEKARELLDNNDFDDIVLENISEDDFHVVAEFVEVLAPR